MTSTRTDQVLAALRGSATTSPPLAAPKSPVSKQRDDVRFTFDVARDLHRYIRQFVLDSDTTASAATRALWTLVQDDPGLAERLRGRLANGPERGVQ